MEADLHRYAVYLELGLALPTLLLLIFVKAPYGRHHRAGWGPTIPSRMAWILMELPASAGFCAIFFLGDHATKLAPLVLLGVWQLHYVHRTFIFPFRLNAQGKTMPASIVAMGAGFNCLNAYVNARWISHFGAYGFEWLADPRFIAGIVVFLVGMAINLHADTVLIRLREESEKKYSIPHGGLYRWISAPNYFGEIVEWIGWAIMTWSLGGLAFAVYTIANLAPRAFSNHRWYVDKFEDYPPERRALVPFVM